MRTIRAEFTKKTCEQALDRCFDAKEDDWRCEYCSQLFAKRRPEFHHHIPAALGGSNSLWNCRVICPPCHRIVTKLEDLPTITKMKAVLEKRAGLRRPKQKIQSAGFRKWA
jgi:5-methylcytosine-specific restriction protein A